MSVSSSPSVHAAGKTYTGAEIAKQFFEKTDLDDVFTCKYCADSERTFKQNTRKGYTNLTSHAKCHDNFDAIMKTASAANVGPMEDFVRPLSKGARKIYGWLDLIINGNLPFSSCENKVYKRYLNLDPVGRMALTLYRDLVHTEVEALIQQDLPRTFGIIFDGKTSLLVFHN
jgi:hypothetical protein